MVEVGIATRPAHLVGSYDRKARADLVEALAVLLPHPAEQLGVDDLEVHALVEAQALLVEIRELFYLGLLSKFRSPRVDEAVVDHPLPSRAVS